MKTKAEISVELEGFQKLKQLISTHETTVSQLKFNMCRIESTLHEINLNLKQPSTGTEDRKSRP